MEEKKLTEVLERMEKKQNQLLESMAVVFNCLLSETIKEEPKDASEKEEKQCKMEVLLTHRDECMEMVHGEKYRKHIDKVNNQIAGDILKDILENILK